MRILIVGGGGREHAIAWKLKSSPRVEKLYAAPGNGGIAQIAECIPLKATDVEGIAAWCADHPIDFVVVAPDDPLCMGMVDKLQALGIPAFGPNQAAARIEGSKVFAKELMRKYHIPTAEFQSFDRAEEALSYVACAQYPLVVKCDGLALGKGVLICQNPEEGTAAVRSIMMEGAFGASGSRVVIEQFLTGPEVSVLAFTDGRTLRPMVSSMDHKRALDGDQGLNTGGMGAVAPNPYYTEEMASRCMEEIFLPTIRAMAEEGCPFQGCLYFGLMLTPQGPKVIEYNCRFGDPETQVVLPLLQSDLLTIMEAVVSGTLDQAEVKFTKGHSCCVMLASGGYPGKYGTGYPIEGLENVPDDVQVFHSGTQWDEDHQQFVTSGGRVLGLSAVSDTLSGAIKTAYAGADQIHFEHKHCRRDIGRSALGAIQSDCSILP